MQTTLLSLDRGLVARGFSLALIYALIAQLVWAPAQVLNATAQSRPLGLARVSDPAASVGGRIGDAVSSAGVSSPTAGPSLALPVFLADSPRASPEAARLYQGTSPSISKSASITTTYYGFTGVFTYTLV